VLVSRLQPRRYCTSEPGTNLYNTLAEIRGQTKFSRAELEALHAQFLQKSGNDNMNLQEFSKQMGSLGLKDSTLIKKTFEVFDVDNDGFVDFREFASGMSIITRGSISDKYEFAFHMWDEDNSGTLDKNEFEKFLRTSQGRDSIDSKLFEQIWAGIDVDCDGHVNLAETKAGITRHQLATHGLPFSDPVPIEGVPQTMREIISLVGENQHVTAGETIVVENVHAEDVYVLVSGSVKLSRSGQVVSEISKGGSVLASEGLLGLKSAFTLSATAPCHFVKVSTHAINPLIFHSHPGAIVLVENALSALMARYQETTMLGLKNDVIAKDAEFSALKAEAFTKVSLMYHSLGKNGKLEIRATKQVGTAEELSVAYSPGVAEPCLAIQKKKDLAYEYTSKGHLVGVVSNGTAVLGLGNIGAAASKPVMEGKAVLFKKFGGIDAFDIELDCSDPEKFIDMVVALEPTFGGINIEDVKAPECFYIEKECQRRSSIPIMHDDQHGTAIIAGAGLLNALQLVKKNIQDIKVVVCGCGAAGFTCAKYFISLGVKKENLIALDVKGVIYKGRPDLDDPTNYLCEIAADTPHRTLPEALVGADVFLGVSAARLLTPEMLKTMATDPLVFAMANPVPEISYSLARRTRSDVLMATGRSDYPNQINNVCAFPYIFRGALDCRATAINEEIKQAATKAIAEIAKSDTHLFGRDYIIPKPFDPRLKVQVSAAVVEAAMASGVARLKLDMKQYKEMLQTEDPNL